MKSLHSQHLPKTILCLLFILTSQLSISCTEGNMFTKRSQDARVKTEGFGIASSYEGDYQITHTYECPDGADMSGVFTDSRTVNGNFNLDEFKSTVRAHKSKCTPDYQNLKSHSMRICTCAVPHEICLPSDKLNEFGGTFHARTQKI